MSRFTQGARSQPSEPSFSALFTLPYFPLYILETLIGYDDGEGWRQEAEDQLEAH